MATTDQSIRSYLDSLGQLPGCILYRNTIAWEALAPGRQGQILTLNPDGLPTWTNGPGYPPARQQFDGSSGQYTLTFTSTGNKASGYFLMRLDPFTGGGVRRPFVVLGPSGSGATLRANLTVFASDHADPWRRNRLAFITRTPTSGFGVFYVSLQDVCTGTDKLVGWSYDGDHGLAQFTINGEPAANEAAPDYIAPTPQTLQTGANSKIRLASNFAGTFYEGQLAQVGYTDDYIPDWSIFPTDPDQIFTLDTTTWDEWQGQPHLWAPYGNAANNQGTAPPATPSGTITLVTA